MKYTLLLVLVIIACESPKNGDFQWPVAGGDPGRAQFAGITSITPENVAGMERVWEYRTGDAHKGSQIQCNPIIIDKVLYGTTAAIKLFALDASTGMEMWVFDPSGSLSDGDYSPGMNSNRGVTYWSDGDNARVLYVVGPYLFSVDAATGLPDTGFGDGGIVDLHDGLDRDVADLFITATSPGVIYGDLLILGSRVSEGKEAAPGHIRAFNVRDGSQAWIFHTIPHPGETGYETWEDSSAYQRVGGANAWSGFSLDTKRGVVFAGTGSASFDFYGGDRKGANLFANSVLAIEARTGKYKWHFQTIHHDVWDRDLPVPPVLGTIDVDGKSRDVVIQATKTGFLFVLDRDTGEPVFPVEEVEVPVESELIGEKLWPTQPKPVTMPPLMKLTFEESDLNDIAGAESFEDTHSRFMAYKHGAMFTPPSETGTIFYPGLDGGAEWGGSSFDESRGILYINVNQIPWVMTNVKLTNSDEISGRIIYERRCMACHGKDLQGAGNYPAIDDAGSRLSTSDIHTLLKTGRRMMPSFTDLDEEQTAAIIEYVLEYNPDIVTDEVNEEFAGYSVSGYTKFQTPEGLPANKPPWGLLNAVDVPNQRILWQLPLGEYPGLDSLGVVTGTENYGGPVATAGGVVFIAATMDSKIRAFDAQTGSILWEDVLPVPGYATPAVYEIDGRPFLVIACGGGKLGSSSGDYYVAYSLSTL